MRGAAAPLLLIFLLVGHAASAYTPSAAFSPPSPTVQTAPAKPKHSLRVPALQFALGAAASALAVPAAIAFSSWVGTLSSSYYVSGASALVLYLLIPAFAVTGASYWMGNALEPGAYRFWPAFGATLGAHVLCSAVAVLLGASAGNLGDTSSFTLIEMLVLPAIATLTFQMLRGEPVGEPLIAAAQDRSPPPLRPLLTQEHPVPTARVLAFNF